MNGKIEIQIGDYITEGEVRELVEDEIRIAIRKQVSDWRSLNTLIGNVANLVVWDAIDEHMGCDAKALIAEKIPKVIDEISPYAVFRSKDNWKPQDSVGQQLLDEVVAESKGLIAKRVEEVIGELDPSRLRTMVEDSVSTCIYEWMDGK